jgi:hypothetical protein
LKGRKRLPAPETEGNRTRLREQAALDEFGSALNAARRVHLQKINRGPPHSCKPDQTEPAQRKMRIPIGTARIEKSHDFVSLRIYTGEIRVLVPVAAMASPREVIGLGLAAVLTSDYVLEMKWL